jgi:RNA polymerase sigma factor (sigma-70 family)
LEIREAAVLESVADAKAPIPETVTVDRLALTQALAALQPRQRTLIVLREQEGWSAREIGEAMGWNEKRVHNELFKTRQQLLRLRQEETNGGIE